ncbi:MAG: hypothetical protein WCF13_05985, partial [Stellaceae bacterium]
LEGVNQIYNQLIATKLAGRVRADPEQAIRLAQRLQAQLQNRISVIKTGGCQKISSDDVLTFVNSLQVIYASRFVMSKAADFALAERMILDNEKYRSGIKPKLD